MLKLFFYKFISNYQDLLRGENFNLFLEGEIISSLTTLETELTALCNRKIFSDLLLRKENMC